MSVYKKDQLVWAKVKGYAWWPALVAKDNVAENGEIEKEIQVNFVGEDTHAVLSQDKIAAFQDKYREYSKTKTKKLQEALKLALNIEKERPKSADDRPSSTIETNKRSSSARSATKDAPAKRPRGRPRKVSDTAQDSFPSVNNSKSRANKTEMEIEEPKAPIPGTSRKGRPRKQDKKEMELEEVAVSKERKESEKHQTAQKGRPKKANKKEMEVEEPVVKERQVFTTARKPRSKGRGKKAEEEKHERSNTELVVEIEAYSSVKKDNKKTNDEVNLQDFAQNRLTRSQRKKDNAEIITEPILYSSRKGKGGKKSTSSKKAAEALAATIAETEQPKLIPEEKPSKLNYEFKPPAAKPRTLLFEKPQERNLLRSINAEPSTQTHIQVTTRKLNMSKSGLQSAISKVGEKRSSAFWLNNASNPTYLSNFKPKEMMRNSATEMIVKKVRMSPMLQQRMSSIKATNIKDITRPRNNIIKAMIAYNSLMIRKFETDLEQILVKLSNKFKEKELMKENDVDQLKLLNIISEFEKSQFNGSEFISSEVGKLFKTIQRLMINNKLLLNSSGNFVIATLTKVIHQIKERIIRFCLDNSDYADAFDVTGDTNEFFNDIENINFEQSRFKQDDFKSGAKDSRMLSEEVQVKKEVKKEEEISRSSRSNSSFKEDRRSSDVLSNHGSGNKQPLTVIVRNQNFKKFVKLIQDSYFMDRVKAQDIALGLEEMVSKCYRELFTDYNQAIKVIGDLIKNESFTTEELYRFKDMDLNSFKNVLRIKRRDVEDVRDFTFRKDTEDYGVFGRRHGKTDSFSSLDDSFGFPEKRNNSISKSFETIL